MVAEVRRRSLTPSPERRQFTGFRIRSTFCHGNSDLFKIGGFFQQRGINNFALRPILTAQKNPYQLCKSDLFDITEYYDQIDVFNEAGEAFGLPLKVADEFKLTEKDVINEKTQAIHRLDFLNRAHLLLSS